MTPAAGGVRGGMAYPGSGWRRLVFRAPLLVWRLGLARVLPANFLVLTTRGRRSGEPRHTMLEHAEIGGCFYVGAGWGRRSQWVLNLEAEPRVSLQTRRQAATGARAALATDPDALRAVYHAIRGASPAWDRYLAMWAVRDDEADFVAAHGDGRLLTYRLDPLGEPGPAPLAKDLRWATALVLAAALGVVALAVSCARRA